MKKQILCVIAALFLAGCGAKPVLVQSGQTTYAFSEKGTDHDKEGGGERDKVVDATFTVPQYILLFREAGQVEEQQAVKGGGLNIHHARAAVLGGALVASPLAGTVFGGFNAMNLGVSLLAASQQKAYIQLSVNGYYNAASDGTITIARWIPDAKPHEAAAQGFNDIKEILKRHCGFSPRPSGFKKFADRAARVDGKCEAKGYYTSVSSDASGRYSNFHQVMGEGSIVTFYFPASHWSEQERKDLARDLRETLPAGWYVMRAMPVEDAATGQMEPRYMVSMGGENRAFPLPPKPVFQ